MKAFNAKTEPSNANQDTALLRISAVMEIVIAAICLTKLDALQNIQEVVIALKIDSNATIISACLTPTFAMVLTTVEVSISLKYVKSLNLKL